MKHYAQTTEEHFERATCGAESGAKQAQNRAQPIAAESGGDSQTTTATLDLANVSAVPNESQRNLTKCQNGEGGIRTLGEVAPTPVFETGTFGHSVTSPGFFKPWHNKSYGT
jgi:hypothetical protein